LRDVRPATNAVHIASTTISSEITTDHLESETNHGRAGEI